MAKGIIIGLFLIVGSFAMAQKQDTTIFLRAFTISDLRPLVGTGIIQAPNSMYPPGFSTAPYYSQKHGEVVSGYDTVILFKGLLRCNHKWAVKETPISYISCAVMHDDTGCPNNWLNEYRICTICLRHENIKETRYVVYPKDEYTEYFNKLKHLKN